MMTFTQQLFLLAMLLLLALVFDASMKTFDTLLSSSASAQSRTVRAPDEKTLSSVKALTVVPAAPNWSARFKRRLAELRLGVKSLVRDSGERFGARGRAVCRPGVLKAIAGDLAWIVLLSAALEMCSVRSGSADAFASVLIPIVVICAVLVFYCETSGGETRKMTMIICLMIVVGFSLQASLAAQTKNGVGALGGYTATTIFALLLAAMFGVPLLRLLTRFLTAKTALWTLQLTSLAMYLILLGTKSVNGANLWITVGGVSLQMTEICKLAALTAFGIVFGSRELQAREQSKAAFGVLLLHAAFLSVVNEFSTALILVATFALMGLCLAADRRRLILGLVLLALAAALLLVPCKLAYDRLHPADGPAVMEQTAPVARKLAGVYEKSTKRLLAVTDPEQAGDFGYQQSMARRVMLLAGWFGTSYNVAVPVAESDFVFAVLVLRLGIVTAVLFLLMWASLPAAAIPALRPQSVEGVTALAFLLAMLLTAVGSIGSTTGCLPTMGVAPPFLGRGGTAALVHFTMTLFMIMGSRDKEACFDE